MDEIPSSVTVAAAVSSDSPMSPDPQPIPMQSLEESANESSPITLPAQMTEVEEQRHQQHAMTFEEALLPKLTPTKENSYSRGYIPELLLCQVENTICFLDFEESYNRRCLMLFLPTFQDRQKLSAHEVLKQMKIKCKDPSSKCKIYHFEEGKFMALQCKLMAPVYTALRQATTTEIKSWITIPKPDCTVRDVVRYETLLQVCRMDNQAKQYTIETLRAQARASLTDKRVIVQDKEPSTAIFMLVRNGCPNEAIWRDWEEAHGGDVIFYCHCLFDHRVETVSDFVREHILPLHIERSGKAAHAIEVVLAAFGELLLRHASLRRITLVCEDSIPVRRLVLGFDDIPHCAQLAASPDDRQRAGNLQNAMRQFFGASEIATDELSSWLQCLTVHRPWISVTTAQADILYQHTLLILEIANMFEGYLVQTEDGWRYRDQEAVSIDEIVLVTALRRFDAISDTNMLESSASLRFTQRRKELRLDVCFTDFDSEHVYGDLLLDSAAKKRRRESFPGGPEPMQIITLRTALTQVQGPVPGVDPSLAPPLFLGGIALSSAEDQVALHASLAARFRLAEPTLMTVIVPQALPLPVPLPAAKPVASSSSLTAETAGLVHDESQGHSQSHGQSLGQMHHAQGQHHLQQHGLQQSFHPHGQQHGALHGQPHGQPQGLGHSGLRTSFGHGLVQGQVLGQVHGQIHGQGLGLGPNLVQGQAQSHGQMHGHGQGHSQSLGQAQGQDQGLVQAQGHVLMHGQGQLAQTHVLLHGQQQQGHLQQQQQQQQGHVQMQSQVQVQVLGQGQVQHPQQAQQLQIQGQQGQGIGHEKEVAGDGFAP